MSLGKTLLTFYWVGDHTEKDFAFINITILGFVEYMKHFCLTLPVKSMNACNLER